MCSVLMAVHNTAGVENTTADPGQKEMRKVGSPIQDQDQDQGKLEVLIAKCHHHIPKTVILHINFIIYIKIGENIVKILLTDIQSIENLKDKKTSAQEKKMTQQNASTWETITVNTGVSYMCINTLKYMCTLIHTHI